MSHKSTRLHEHAEQQQQEQKNTDHHEQTFEGNQQPQLPDDDVTDLPVEPEMGIQHEEEETLHALYQKTQLIENQLQQKIQLIENQLHHEIQTINDKIEIMTNQFEEQMKELKSIIQNEQTARVTSNRLIEPRDIPLEQQGGVTFTDRQKKVLEIYNQRHAANLHKMVEIPRCIIPPELKAKQA
ncbi:unnamed protein product [Adineta ricciae]|uniref:Uncharacterized protein n=1 Tax=Adineta ricciae TaxID=249248 RepID=A0A815L8B1_ADIRI|nr:unnamed protein product [Adineta ricciae]